jgi:hypothetical protein
MYFFVLRLLVKCEVEVEDGLLQKFSQVNFLPSLGEDYLYSLTITVSQLLTVTTSVSPLVASFLERGRFRMATNILGCSIFENLIIKDTSQNNLGMVQLNIGR